MTLDHRDDREWLAQQMLLTNGQAFREDMEMLQEILRERPAWVRDTINRFLQEEEARTFQNVVGQIALYRDMLSEIAEIVSSEDAVALRHLIKDIHPSNVRGLQREAQSIGEEMTELRLCIGNQDWETMYGLMQRIKNEVRRFRDKFTDLYPKLDRLAKKVAELATKCDENAKWAEVPKQKVEAHRDRWLWFLGNFGLFIGICSGVGLLGGGIGALVLDDVLQVKSAALTAAMSTAAEASAAATAAAAASKAAAAKVVTANAAAAGPLHIAVGVVTGGAALVGTLLLLLPSAPPPPQPPLPPLPPVLELLVDLVAVLFLLPLLLPLIELLSFLGLLAGLLGSLALLGLLTQWLPTLLELLVEPVTSHASASAVTTASTAAEEATAAAATAAAANAHVASLQAVIASLSGWAAFCTPCIAVTGVVLALFMLGWLGCDVLKSLLGRLWAAEIQAHEQCAAGWRRLEQDLKTAARQLRKSTTSCEELDTCLDAMFGGVEHACGILEDHKTYPREGDLEGLVREVDELCSSYESAISAFEHVQAQVMSLQNHANNSKYLSNLLSDARTPLTHHSNLPIVDDRAPVLENVQADGSSSVSMLQLQVEVDEGVGRGLPQIYPQEVTLPPDSRFPIAPASVPSPASMPVEPASIPSLADEGWILVESEPLGTSTVSFPANLQFLSGRHDCIPGKTYLLVPIEFASRFGALRAAGPSGDRICEVTEEESNQRLMSVLRLCDGEHRLTANHLLRVSRSGVWIQEQAARLQLGDSIVTTMGVEAVSKMPATLLSTEPVYRLDTENTHFGKGEVFICTFVHDNDHKRFSGIAVLSSPKQENSSMRASSAPPLRMSGRSSSGFGDEFPSIGSRLHQEGCCRNVCKKFLRGRCEEAGECRFCHFPHPEESKRAPRGSRNNRGRGGAQSSNLS